MQNLSSDKLFHYYNNQNARSFHINYFRARLDIRSKYITLLLFLIVFSEKMEFILKFWSWQMEAHEICYYLI